MSLVLCPLSDFITKSIAVDRDFKNDYRHLQNGTTLKSRYDIGYMLTSVNAETEAFQGNQIYI
jgi:hypothetical protein